MDLINNENRTEAGILANEFFRDRLIMREGIRREY